MRKAIQIILIAALCVALTVPAYAAPYKTLAQRSTWDIDMINADKVSQTGDGVYVAVVDTGLTANWKDYFPQGQVMEKLGKGFEEKIWWDSKAQQFVETGELHETTFIGTSSETHGTHVTSTILGYNYYSPSDAAQGYPISPVFIKGVAPKAKIIPIKVLSEYHIGASQTDPINYPDQTLVFGTDRAVAAGIDYATSLYKAGYTPMVITMSLGGPAEAPIIEDAINRAIDAGVIVVASAGNEGMAGMGWPGAYDQVISVGACGWTYEWFHPGFTAPDTAGIRYRMWWLQDSTYGYNDVSETNLADQVYITEWSSRELDGQYLDVIAPGSWVRGPYPGNPGYSHLPWWSAGNPRGIVSGGSFFYVGGTSMAAPHVTGVVALMLQKDPSLDQAQVESILKSTALPIKSGSATVWDISPAQGWYTYSWGKDATGSGLIQADKAVKAA